MLQHLPELQSPAASFIAAPVMFLLSAGLNWLARRVRETVPWCGGKKKIDGMKAIRKSDGHGAICAYLVDVNLLYVYIYIYYLCVNV